MEEKKRALTRAAASVATAFLVLSAAFVLSTCVLADATPRGISFKNFDYFGYGWADAEKSPTNPNDDLMCWAATAANVLYYTGWGHVAGMSNADQMFTYFVDHWTNQGGLMEFGWDWWFDGTNNSQGWQGWSQVDVPGGGFYPTRNFRDYYHEQWNTSLVMSGIDQFLRVGCGVGLALYGPGGHAVTCWGYNYDAQNPSTYYGIWVTDSDDDKSLVSPPDRLRYYDVAFSGGRWYLQNFYGSNSWYIGGVEALKLIPEPAGIFSLLCGLAGVLVFRRSSRR